MHGREGECKQHAFKDLNQFDRKQWRQWTRTLPQRAARVRPGSVVFLHLALEKWIAAYDLHKHALRTRSQASWHELRIGIKRFRYTVENFLPRQHVLWGGDLKELQDLLGEVHDLDVLWAMAVEVQAFPDVESRNRWREKVNAERAQRIARYREKMVGRQSLWRVWRAELPSGPRLRAAAMSRLRVWAGYRDPDFAHSERVARLALLLYDGLKNAGLGLGTMTTKPETSDLVAGDVPGHVPNDWRAVLQAAALMRDVGKAKGAENHQKHSYRMIRGLTPPLGWSAPRTGTGGGGGALPSRGVAASARKIDADAGNGGSADRRGTGRSFAPGERTGHAPRPRERTLSAARSQRAGPLCCGAGGGILGAGPLGGRYCRGASFAGDGAAAAGAGAGVAGSDGKAQIGGARNHVGTTALGCLGPCRSHLVFCALESAAGLRPAGQPGAAVPT